MTPNECIKRKNMVAYFFIGLAYVIGILTLLIVGYWTVYDGAISAVNAIFHTKSAEQFVWGALRFWFGFAVSIISGALAAGGILLIGSPFEHYYMKKIGKIRRGEE